MWLPLLGEERLSQVTAAWNAGLLARLTKPESLVALGTLTWPATTPPPSHPLRGGGVGAGLL